MKAWKGTGCKAIPDRFTMLSQIKGTPCMKWICGGGGLAGLAICP